MSKRTNYNKFSSPQQSVEEVKETVEETVEIATEEAVVEEPKKEVATMTGYVANCAKLNVRRKPNTQSEPACVIPEGSEVTIFKRESTKEFYKVRTENGVEGYCMKQFISVE